MATLTIRDLDDDVKARLRIRAAQHGRSMEAEARVLLAAALAGSRPARGLGTHLRQRFTDVGGVELETARSDEPARVVDLGA